MIRISNHKKSALLLSALIVAGLFLPAPKTYAQETFQGTIREIAGKISTLLMFRKDSNSPTEEKLAQEVMARKEAVRKIFELTSLEQKDLLSRLAELKELNSQQEKMRDTLSEFVKENGNSLKEIESRLEDAADLEEIKQLAADFKNWRAVVYNPKTEKVVAFTFVFNGRNIISVANSRLDKIKDDLDKHRESLDGQSKEALSSFNRAESYIRDAEELNGQAINLIMIALTNQLSAVKISKQMEKDIARDIADSKNFTEKSMQLIRKAYGEFLNLGKTLNR